MVLLALGAFNVSVKYLFKPKGRRTWHYRRHVPSGVKAHYDQPHILKSLLQVITKKSTMPELVAQLLGVLPQTMA